MLGILDDVKVVELSGSLSGAYCAKLLADQGAATVKVEPPDGGDPARLEPPFISEEPGPDGSSLFLAFNTNKRGVTLDVGKPEGRRIFLRLVQNADVVIESFSPGYLEDIGLGYAALAEANPKLILTSMTYFGQTGPYSGFAGSDLVAQATGGFLHAVTGSADRPPMGTVLEQMEITAARNGAIATLAALMHRKQTALHSNSGSGGEAGNAAQHIDVSTMEATVSTPSGLIHPYSFTGRSPKRGGSDGNVMDGMHLFTKDGEVTLTTAGTGGRPMEAWAEFLEEPGLLDPKFANRRGRMENWEELYDLVAPKLAQWNNLDLMEATMARGLVIGLVQNPQQVVESPHLNERGALVEIDHPVNGPMLYAGPGFLMDGINPMEGSIPAPRLGEHNEQVYCHELGLSIIELENLQEAGIV